MYYGDEIIEQVRSSVNIVDIVGSYVRLTKKGSTYFGLCPFHSEKSGSFAVSPTRQTFHCFGCGEGGNVISFIMKYENMSFVEALKLLADKGGVKLPEAQQTPEEKSRAKIRQELYDIYKLAATYYYGELKKPGAGHAYNYLTGRGLSNETIRSFGLGYSPMNSGLYKLLKDKGYKDQIIKESGIFRFSERGSRDIFWNRVMFPIMDVNSRVIAFGGRVMGEGEPKYLNSPDSPIFEKNKQLYGLHAAKRSRKDFFLICEGYMDVIALHQAGFTNAVASLGTAFGENHARIIKKYVKKVVLTFDSDGAGRKAALRAIPILRRAGIAISVLNMKPYKDPDEFIKNLGAQEYEKRIEAANNAFLFDVGCLRENFDLNDPDEKTDFINQTASKLALFSDEVERNNYIEAVSREFSIDYQLLKRKVNSIGAGKGFGEEMSGEEPEYVHKKPKKAEAADRSEIMLLGWMCDDIEIYRKVKEYLSPDDFTEGICRDVASMAFSMAEADGRINSARIMNSYLDDEEGARRVSEMFSETLPENLPPADKSKAVTQALKSVLEKSMKHRIMDLGEKVRMKQLLGSLKIEFK